MSRKGLIIVGASGHGREVAHTFLQDHPEKEFAGFLDDMLDEKTPEGWPVLGKVAEWTRWPDHEFVVGINDPRLRRKVVSAMQSLGTPRWGSVIHPGVAVHASVTIGHGATILGGVEMTVNIEIGKFVSINRLAALGHDCELGDFTSLAPLASLSGNVSAGPGVDIGTSAAIRQRLTLGRGCGVGMGSVVIDNVPANTLVVGNPADTLRELDPW
ncbi:MAG: acetyltransferase [Planctomycetes bacterium]|nr:acetyltransferase [Planctomycetota bacterium]